ncbi:MAG: Vanillate O-demethylase monooxygenase subunit [Nevskia sp.]|nr:Vanillate O-demethylase monooxygenase subunit [Nevskia sp.]
MQFLKSAWYVAAFGDEVGKGLFERRICDESIVMFRREDGSVAALTNRCPHRFAPLSRGKLLPGGVIKCGYHGLEFDGAGACVHNPHGTGAIPAAARIRSWPAIERHGMIWLWMGLAEDADPDAIPDFSFAASAEYNTQRGVLSNRGSHELYIDNLMDLSHVPHLHPGTLGNDEMEGGKRQFLQDETTVASNTLYENVRPSPFWDMQFGGAGEPVDHWQDISWRAPAHMLLDVGVTKPGRARSEGVAILTLHIITPETATSTHYFWSASRRYAMDNTGLDKAIHEVVASAFTGEDEPMIAAVQESMGGKTFDELRPVLLAPDAAAMRVRRALKKLIAAESGQHAPVAEVADVAG